MNAYTSKTWHKQVLDRLHHWIKADDRFLVAVSGGADSMGLLALIADSFKWPKENFVVGHVNHGIRADASLDAELIRSECMKRGIEFEDETVDTPALIREEKLSVEVAARRLRYQALYSIAHRNNCRWILTGHTLDDSAETVWMRMSSGAPWYEWTGIPERRNSILRPLIGIIRSELRKWVNEEGIKFRDDSTNSDISHLRNRIRTELSKKQWFWTNETIFQTATGGQNLQRFIETVRKLIRLRFYKAYADRRNNRIGLEIDGIFRYFKGLNFLPVEVAWADLTGNPDGRLPSAIRKQIPQFLSGTSPQARIRLPNQITALRQGSKVWLSLERNWPVSIPVAPGTYAVPERQGMLSIFRAYRETADGMDGIKVSIAYAEKNLWLRNWRPGDRLKPRGRPTKKVSALLAEKKLDPIARARTIVLADDTGPLIIPGITIAQRAEPNANDPEVLLVTWKTEYGTNGNDDH